MEVPISTSTITFVDVKAFGSAFTAIVLFFIAQQVTFAFNPLVWIFKAPPFSILLTLFPVRQLCSRPTAFDIAPYRHLAASAQVSFIMA
jgi:hypothetical protein